MKFKLVTISFALCCVNGFAKNKDSNNNLVKEAKNKITENFKDPDSAKFRNVGVYKAAKGDGELSVCGEVNAKNSYGAYVGYRSFVYGGGLSAIEDPEEEGLHKILYPILCFQLIKSVN